MLSSLERINRGIVTVTILLAIFPAVSRGASEGTPVSAESYFHEGLSYLLEGNEVKATELFDKAISFDKAYSAKALDEYYRAGLLLIKNPKKSNIGMHYLDKYLDGKPEREKELAPVLYEEGLRMITQNKFMAHVLIERAMRLNPLYEKDDVFYFAYSVRSASKSADLIQGSEDFLSKFPQSSHVPEVLYWVGEAYVDLRKPHEARRYFNRASKEFPDTEWGKKAAAR